MLALIALEFLLGCGSLVATNICDILKDPRRFDGKVVTVSGRVKDSANIVLIKFFVLEDDTGEIMVVTQRSVPREGARVPVKGQVNQAFSIGGRNLVVVVEDRA
jgi:aspartyl/asparaginyl-tRNA synthetase